MSRQQGDTSGLLSAVSRALHASPWAPAARTRIALLLMSSAAILGSEDEDAASNLDLVDRMVREHVDHGQDASLRTQRCRVRGLVELLGKAHETADDEVAQGRHRQSGLAWLEKAVFAAPWDQTSRLALSKVPSLP